MLASVMMMEDWVCYICFNVLWTAGKKTTCVLYVSFEGMEKMNL